MCCFELKKKRKETHLDNPKETVRLFLVRVVRNQRLKESHLAQLNLERNTIKDT